MRRINTSPKFPTDNLAQNAKWLLLGVTLLAISLRIWGIDFGLPYLYHPDEPVGVRIAQSMFKTRDLNPHFFDWPSLPFYINALAYIPYYLVGKLIGIFQSPADIPGPIMLAMGVGQTPMRTTFLLGRILTVTFGSAAVVLVFLIGRKLSNNTAVGLLAALMMAISPTNVANSRFITPETFLVFFVLLSFCGSVQVFHQGKTWPYIVAGIASGLAASTKYNGALIVLSVVSAHFLRCGLRGFKERRLYLALALSAAAFFVTTPFAILDHQKFLAALQFDAQHYSTGHAGMEGNTLSWYLAYLWRVEGPVALLAVLEILRGIYARSKQTILLSTFPLVYFTFISSLVVRNDRTLLPVTPFLFLLASSLLASLLRQTNIGRSKRKLPIFAIGALILISLTLPFLQTVKNTIRLTTVDSRETARIWIDDNLPNGARIAIESYAPYVDPQRFSVQGIGAMIHHPAEWYITNGFEYLIFGQGMFGRFYREPDRYFNEVAAYESLFRAFDMVKTFTDGGYEVRIYHVAER
jgi:4-amino-4-deoxy-L-arabinose transferase-like glycosyltransferase